MIICKECGYETTRIQWTHLRYKCTGRFQSIKEYIDAYPDAPIVDPDLAKKTAVTKESLIAKYGEVQGNQKWEQYREKQRFSNTFEYKQKKYGWDRDKFDEYNRSRSITLENLIKKYGEVEGAIRWQNYCERQAYTNTEEYFIEKYGVEVGRRKYLSVNRMKAHTLENVIRVHGCNEDEAIDIISNRKINPTFTSKMEKDVILAVQNILGQDIEYSVLSKQYCVYGNNKANFYDIVHNNRCIEIYGDYWHCNPQKYVSNYYHQIIESTASDIWLRDQMKVQLITEKRKIPVLIIWESDIILDMKNTIERCVAWIQDGKK
jgi:hypothetical protein